MPFDPLSPESKQENQGFDPIKFEEELTILGQGTHESGVVTPDADELFRLAGSKWQVDEHNVDKLSQLATYQSTGEQLGRMVKGGALNFTAGFLDNFNYDVPDMVNMMKGTEQKYGSWLSEITDGIRDTIQEDYRIYQDGDDFGSVAYWTNLGQSMAYTTGLIAGTFAEQAALASVTGGLGIASLAGKSKLTQGALFGSVKGVHEGYMNGLETYKSTEQKYLDLGYSKEEAVNKAANAASLGYRLEVLPLMALNGLQFGLVGKYNPLNKSSVNSGYGGAIESVVDKVLPEVGSKFLKGSIEAGVNMISEGAEEGIQTIISKYAQQKTLKRSGDQYTDIELYDHETRDAILMGVVSGGIFQGVGKAFQTYTGRKDKKDQGKKLDEFIAGVGSRVSSDLKDLQKATESGDIEEIRKVKYKAQRENVFEAIRLDAITGKETAFNSYIESLDQVQEAVEKGDEKILKDYGLSTDEDFKFIQENYPKMKEDALMIKESMKDVMGNLVDDMNIAAKISNIRQARHRLFNDLSERESNFSLLKEKDPNYSQLSSQGKEIYDLKLQLEPLLSLEEINSDQKVKIENIEGRLKELKYSNYEGKAQDKAILDLNANYNIAKENMSIYNDKELLTELAIMESKASNKKAIRVELSERRRKKAKTANTVTEVENNLKDSVEDGTVDKDLIEISQQRVDKIKREESANKNVQTLDLSGVTPADQIITSDGASTESPERVDATKEISAITLDLSSIFEGDQSIEEDIPGFEPKNVNLNKSQIEKLKNAVKIFSESLQKDLGKFPTFSEFIEDYIKQSNLEKTDESYKALYLGWTANGYKVPENGYSDTYNTHIQPRSVITDSIYGIVNDAESFDSTEESFKSDIEEVEKATTKEVNPPTGLDENNRVIKSTSERITNGILKAAFAAKKAIRTMIDNTVSFLETNPDDIALSENIDIKKTIDPNGLKVGDKLTISLPDNHFETLVTEWEDDVISKGAIPFKTWLKKKGITDENSPEFWAKVPLVAKDVEGNVLFYIHDSEWYNLSNVEISDTQLEEISKGKENVNAIREKLRKGETVEIEITEKRAGVFDKLDKDTPLQTLSNTDPTTSIVLTVAGKTLLHNGEVWDEGTKRIVNKESIAGDNEGRTYELRKVNSTDYMIFPVHTEAISSEVITSISKALELALDFFDKKRKGSRDKILEATGIDFYKTSNLLSYLQQFIKVETKGSTHITNKIGSEAAEDINRYYNNKTVITKDPKTGEFVHKKLPKGFPYVVENSNGKIYFGRVGDKTTSYLGKNDPKVIAKFLEILPSFKQNVSRFGLKDNKTVWMFTEDNRLVSKGKYDTYLKNTLKTNVKAYNVGTEENPSYATIIQPVINYKEVGEVSPTGDSVTKKIKKAEVLNEKEEVVAEKINKAEIEVNAEEVLSIAENITKNTQTQDETKYDGLKKSTNTIPGLSPKETYQIINFFFFNILKNTGTKYKAKVEKIKAEEAAKKEFNEYLQKEKDYHTKIYEDLKKLPKSEKTSELIAKMESILSQYPNIEANMDLILEKAYKKIAKYSGVKEVNEDMTETGQENAQENEKNFSSTSLENNAKLTSSPRLKRFFSGVNKINALGEIEKGFLGLPLYFDYDKVYNLLEQILASPTAVESNYEAMYMRLAENVEAYPWLSQVLERLNTADNQIKNEFTYNFTRHTLSMKFVMFSKGFDGKYKLQVYDTNGNEITRIIRQSWESELKSKNNSLTYVDSTTGEYKIDQSKAKELLETFNKWELKAKSVQGKGQELDIPNEELFNWLSEFGVNLSNNTIEDLKNGKIKFKTKEGFTVKPEFRNMFTKSSNSSSIFGLFADYLDKISTKQDTSLESSLSNHPYNNASQALKSLANVESKYSVHSVTNSFMDGGKSIYGFTPTKYATDVVDNLRLDPTFRQKLKSKAFNGSSIWLDILEDNSTFRDRFFADHLGITALKELGKKVFGDKEIVSLSESDKELVKLGLFQDTSQGSIETKTGFSTRMARFFFPTMADKSQMLVMNTVAFNFVSELGKSFSFKDGKISLEDKMYNLLFSQLIEPELNRIIEFANKKTDIKGYDDAAGMFLLLPLLNNIKNKDGVRLISLIKENSNKFNSETVKKEFGGQFKLALEDYLQNRVQAKEDLWNGAFVENGQIQYLDDTYLNTISGTTEEKIKLAAFDFIVNDLIAKANLHMTIAGDIAMYSSGKIGKFFNNGDIHSPKTENSYQDAVEKVISVNTGKRLAALVAPGSKLANSKNESYIQIFLDDYIDTTSNLKSITKLLDGKEITDNEIKVLKDALAKETKDMKFSNKEKDRVKEIKDKYPKSNGYFTLEGSDAQEYTTVTEHILLLHKQGRMSDEVFERVAQNLDQGVEISPDDLGIVLQPIKPVYNGFVEDSSSNTMRMMYIKSSSFPLIPQLTKGLELDKLRVKMEELEDTQFKPVRASYQTANKVGSMKNVLRPFKSDGSFDNNLTLEDFHTSSKVLPRDNFRIQQDVPFKTGKRTEDTITLGTQMLKILFGDGMTELDGFIMDGKSYTGEELKSVYNNAFTAYIGLKRKNLIAELGLDPKNLSAPTKESLEKLQAMLISEAEDRGYSTQTIDSLGLQEGKNGLLEFKLPIWLSPDSNRIESMLNAIVVNRLSKVKLPGNSYVVGSEAGFKVSSDISNVENPNQIIYTSSWKGQLEAAEIEDGKLKKTQVLLPSKFRDDEGNLIKFFNEDGTPNDLYVTKGTDGTYRLKEGMIDPELLNLTSFRIPSSSHVSASQIEIVGVLPHAVGDLMIVPRNLTKQKGLDFDIDKENTYQLWHYVSSDGKIKVLDEENGTEEKLLENTIVKATSSVMSNPSIEVQKKVQQILSMDFAGEQADLIQDTIDSARDNKYFSMLDDTYQMQKMDLGAAGKIGIGVYSNAVVFNALLEQDSQIQRLQYVDPKTKYKEDIEFTIGNLHSKGILGSKETIKPENISQKVWNKAKRGISEVLGERQNTATDNEKEQIMGRVNINEFTINVDTLLTLLGFDKDFLEDKTEVSVPYLLLSQPIIKEYVSNLKQLKSSTQEFSATAEEDVINALKEKYKQEGEKALSEDLTPDALFNNLTETDPRIQTAVLNLFTELNSYAQSIGKVQKLLSTKDGLGKSNFGAISRYQAIIDLPSYTLVSNITSLLGDFKEETNDPDYISFGKYKVKPTTPIGAMVLHTANVGYNLWKNFFPYENPGIAGVLAEVVNDISSESTSEKKRIELKEFVFKEMKKYLFSSQNMGIIKGDPQVRRKELFFDSEDHTSLATYLHDIASDPDFNEYLMDNSLISKFTYKLDKSGQPSLIVFNNAKGEEFDEEYIYQSLINLLVDNKPLKTFNDKEITSTDLAEMLIEYSYLEGGIQEATQFNKFIPTGYLMNETSFAEIARSGTSTTASYVGILGISNDGSPSRFARQFAQHNPGRLTKVSADSNFIGATYSGEQKTLNNLMSFSLGEEFIHLEGKNFISVYNADSPKGQSKFMVFERSGNGFRRISTLAVSGMSQYNLKQDEVISLVGKSVINPSKPEKKVSPPAPKSKSDIFDVFSGNLSNILNAIVSVPFKSNSKVKAFTEQLLDVIPNIPVEIVSFKEKFGKSNASGAYFEGKIYIDDVYYSIASDDRLANTILHETVHTLTKDYLKDKNTTEYRILDMLLSKARTEIGQNKLKDAERRFKEDKELSNYETNIVLGLQNVEEFVAFMMSNPDFLNRMKAIEYVPGKSLYTKFKEVLQKILGKVTGKNIATESLSAILNIINQQGNSGTENINPAPPMDGFDFSGIQTIEDQTIDPNYQPTQYNPEKYGNFEVDMELDKLITDIC